MKQYAYHYTVCKEACHKAFRNACKKIESSVAGCIKGRFAEDVDGSLIQMFHINEKTIVIFNDYEVGAVYVDSDVCLDTLFGSPVKRCMTVAEFIRSYNLHDSLLKSIWVNNEQNTVRLDIDLCYWLQPEYRDGDPESGMVYALFTGVESVEHEPWSIDDDVILQCSHDQDTSTFHMVVTSDGFRDLHSISIRAEGVTLLKRA